MGKDVVVHGATLKCSQSDELSFLKARNLHMEVDGNYVATVADHEPTENILPFGVCKHPKWKDKPCQPRTPSPWEPGEKSVEFAGEVVLDVQSKCECKIGGTIKIIDPGQSRPFFVVDCDSYSPSALKIFALKQRAAMIKEQMDAENEAEAGQRSLLNQLANTALETGKEFSGYNDAGRAFDALRRGDLKGAAWHALSASPFKPAKAASLLLRGAAARRAARRLDNSTAPREPPIRSRYSDGTPVYEGRQPPRISGPDPQAQGPHSVLRRDNVNNRTYQGREFDGSGYPVRDVDFTNPTYPNGSPRPGHPGPPHQHRWEVNDPRVGPKSNFKRGKPEPVD